MPDAELAPGDDRGEDPPPTAPPDISTLYLDPNEYEEVSTIGTGACGAVIKARHRLTGVVFAMKKLFRVDEQRYAREVQNSAGGRLLSILCATDQTSAVSRRRFPAICDHPGCGRAGALQAGGRLLPR
jgi:hypothetical protein